jgi:hypothetical protein
VALNNHVHVRNGARLIQMGSYEGSSLRRSQRATCCKCINNHVTHSDKPKVQIDVGLVLDRTVMNGKSVTRQHTHKFSTTQSMIDGTENCRESIITKLEQPTNDISLNMQTSHITSIVSIGSHLIQTTSATPLTYLNFLYFSLHPPRLTTITDPPLKKTHYSTGRLNFCLLTYRAINPPYPYYISHSAGRAFLP